MFGDSIDGGNRQLNAVTGAGGPYINLCTGQVPRSEHSAVDHHPLFQQLPLFFCFCFSLLNNGRSQKSRDILEGPALA